MHSRKRSGPISGWRMAAVPTTWTSRSSESTSPPPRRRPRASSMRSVIRRCQAVAHRGPASSPAAAPPRLAQTHVRSPAARSRYR